MRGAVYDTGDAVALLRDVLDLLDGLGRWRGRVAHRLDGVGRNDARGRVRLQHQRLHVAPQLVLVRLAPDAAHLGQGVPLNHWYILPHTPQRPTSGVR